MIVVFLSLLDSFQISILLSWLYSTIQQIFHLASLVHPNKPSYCIVIVRPAFEFFELKFFLFKFWQVLDLQSQFLFYQGCLYFLQFLIHGLAQPILDTRQRLIFSLLFLGCIGAYLISVMGELGIWLLIRM